MHLDVQSYFPPPRRRRNSFTGAPTKLGGQMAGNVGELDEHYLKDVGTETTELLTLYPPSPPLVFTIRRAWYQGFSP
jgi:hypothetical protein